LQRERVQRVHACLEATGCYSEALARVLLEQGHTVSVLNPAVLVSHRQSRNTRSKTDKLDAMVLAQYARERQPRAWHPLPCPTRCLHCARGFHIAAMSNRPCCRPAIVSAPEVWSPG